MKYRQLMFCASKSTKALLCIISKLLVFHQLVQIVAEGFKEDKAEEVGIESQNQIVVSDFKCS